MAESQIRLPAAAIAALSRGAVIEAIRIVHASGGGLKEAKQMVETYARQQVGPFLPESDAPARSHVPGTATSAIPAKRVVPPGVHAALGIREKMSAIVQLREANPQLGLKEAKDLVESMGGSEASSGRPAAAPVPRGNTPDAMHRSVRVPTVVSGDGEQPVWLMVGVVLAIAGAAWWAFA